jgi:hypothetical protein
MNIPREVITISEPIMNDPHGRPIVLRRIDTGKDILVTKVIMNEVTNYVSFPVDIEPGTVISGNTNFHVFNSLPSCFRLAEHNFSNSGVIVIQTRPDSYRVENRVLIELIGE